MDLRFTREEEAFRQEVRAWLDEQLPPGWHEQERGPDEGFEFSRAFTRKLAEKGWIAPAWPREYGGMGATFVQQLIFNEEMAYRRAPNTVANAVGLVGPTIILYGSEEQKREHLSRITSADVVWCQGFSEPNAGSDLAALQTTAVEDGDDFIINGQKIWTSGAHRADWIFMLARTDPEAPKHKGISYFLVDMKSPGITVRPLINMADQHGFNEVFFENVRVPRTGLLGEKNRGWYVAAATLDFERSAIANSARIRRSFEDLVRYCLETQHNGGRLIDLPNVRRPLAERAIELEVARMMSYRVVSMQQAGLVPNYEASIAKLFSGDLSQRVAWTGMGVLGLYGQLHPRSKWARLRGRFERAYLITVAITIGGGTSEVQRNIIAMRGLGLPRV